MGFHTGRGPASLKAAQRVSVGSVGASSHIRVGTELGRYGLSQSTYSQEETQAQVPDEVKGDLVGSASEVVQGHVNEVVAAMQLKNWSLLAQGTPTWR